VADGETISRGLRDVRWPARFQRWNERTVIDGAHNPAGCRVLADTWRAKFGDGRAVIILATLRDKNSAGMIDALLPIGNSFVFPEVRTERAVPPQELAALVRAKSALPITTARSFRQAFDGAQATDGRILITGSLHFAGEALASLGGNPDDLEDCAQ
jgi:dihydrofolate synthase/folylpolyglutamate synthase